MSLGDIEACMNDSALALNHLDLLLTSVASEDEAMANHAVEALENCGSPHKENLAIIARRLTSDHSLQVYWAATLLGRYFADASPLPTDLARKLEDSLTIRLTASQLDDSAKEKITWAIGNLPSITDSSKRTLESLLVDASPRLTRLIEKALSKS